MVREQARRAGTRETAVSVRISDRIAPTADGGRLFMGRTFEARLSGRPDPSQIIDETKAENWDISEFK